MRIAIYSDIHANFEAYKAVLRDIKRESIGICVNLGDMVGYGPRPIEVIKTARKLNHKSLGGNHDKAALDEIDARAGKIPLDQRLSIKHMFNAYAMRSSTWTASTLSKHPSLTAYLRSLPLVFDQREGTFDRIPDSDYALRFVHASPKSYTQYALSEHPDDTAYTTTWDYILSCADAHANLETLIPGTLCFTGHTHQPGVISTADGFTEDDFLDWPSSRLPRVLNPSKDARVIVNVGSVGQPRDARIDPNGDYYHWKSKACYCIYDTQTRLVEFRSVAYDIEKTRKQLHDSEMFGADQLADRLLQGN